MAVWDKYLTLQQVSSGPLIMGIVNITPDSFFDGGRYVSPETLAERVQLILSEGADIIDIGAYSTRPGAQHISEEEEWDRLQPALTLIRREFPDAVISVDTFRSGIAKRAVDLGTAIINDISGGTLDPDMYTVIGRLNVPYILMHIQGTPQTMQMNPSYENVVQEVMDYFTEKIALLKSKGAEKIMIDPGFGFGKTVEHNFQLLKNLSAFKSFEFPVVAGLSRKSMLNKLLKTSPEKALNSTTTVNTIALLNGADLLRVHDVKEAKEVIKIVEFYQSLVISH